MRQVGVEINEQITRYRCTRKNLRRHLRCPILIRIAEPSRIREPESHRIIEEGVEYRSGVEDCCQFEVAVFRLEVFYGLGKLVIEVCEEGPEFAGDGFSLLEEEGRSVDWWDG